MKGCSRFAAIFIVALIVALGLVQALAATQKPATCPTKMSQLSGCVKKVDAAKGTIVLACNGIKHQVSVEKGAKITLGNKEVKLKDLKVGTEVTAYGNCNTKATVFKANRICQCSKPRPKTNAK